MASGISRNAKTRPLTIFAQDPSIRVDQEPVLTTINVPAEHLAPGPCGYRIRVVDYDASTGTLYKPMRESSKGEYVDQFAGKDGEELLDNPQFHQQNVYAIAMRVLGSFEFALGRRISWQFGTHQLKVVPHAFREANAFYSRDHEALLFGYFGRGEPDSRNNAPTFTCLSHDIVAHETSHALLDGIRERFLLPSMPDQAAFHEGFSDLVAILSVVSGAELIEKLMEDDHEVENALSKSAQCQAELEKKHREQPGKPTSEKLQKQKDLMKQQITHNEIEVSREAFDSEELDDSLEALTLQLGPAFPLLSLAEQMGENLRGIRGAALRNSLEIKPNRSLAAGDEFAEPHRRGELLVAAILRTLLTITQSRCFDIGLQKSSNAHVRFVSKRQLAECLSKSARDLLTICIRALDYVVPVHVTFGNYLASLLTADYELVGNDSQYQYRLRLRQSFVAYGIGSASDQVDGLWPMATETDWLRLDRTDHHAMMSNPDEMFRFIWENRSALGLSDEFYTRVTSVSPTVRIGPDGMLLPETVVEYVQSAKFLGHELNRRGFRQPPEMPDNARMNLYGGGTLIFDVRGKLKYHIKNRLDDRQAQNERLKYLWERGLMRAGDASFSNLHEERSFRRSNCRDFGEQWR